MSLNVRLLLAFFSIYVVWGWPYLAIRLAVETIPPLATAGVRHLTAGLILYVWARGWQARVTWTEWRGSDVGAVLFFLIGHGTLHWAEQIVPSGIAALLVATEPLWIAILMPGEEASRLSAGALASAVFFALDGWASPCACRRKRSRPAGASWSAAAPSCSAPCRGRSV